MVSNKKLQEKIDELENIIKESEDKCDHLDK